MPRARGGRSLRSLVARARRHAVALGVLAVVLAFGLFAVGDFGFAHDQRTQYSVGKFTLEYALGDTENLLRRDLRYYGAGFEVTLQAAEWLLGLTDDRHIFLSRYILSHCYFLIGAFACYLLGSRIFQSRALAVFVMLFFLCHPRLFGHSFFNSKDTPFLSMMMIALLLAHEALRTGTTRAHVALGFWLGVIGSIRPFALLLTALVPLLYATAFFRAPGGRKTQVLIVSAALLLASAGGLYIALPYLWGAPVARIGEWLALMSNHAHVVASLFMGEVIVTNDRPWSYIPVWFLITTPPVVIVLAIVGGLAFGMRVVRNPRDAFANTPLGFHMLLAATVLVSVLVATFFVGNIYNGWRHLYFIYGPICLFAGGGLAWLGRCGSEKLSALAMGTAALGLLPVVGWIAMLHPHQHVYFNFLVDRKTPERLRRQFDMDYWVVSQKQALEVLLDLRPKGQVPITGMIKESVRVLPAEQRQRIVLSEDFSAFLSTDYRYWWGQGGEEGPSYAEPLHVHKVFSNTLYALVRLQVADFEGSQYQEHYRAALANPPRGAGEGRFQVYWDGEAVTYIAEDCTPMEVERRTFHDWHGPPNGRFFLHVVGDNVTDHELLGQYLHNEDFQFRHRGVVFQDGERRVCMARVPLGDYAVDAITTGQLRADAAPVWSVRISMVDAQVLGKAALRLAASQPQARDQYDVYVEEDALIYVKERCAEADREPSFFLHVVPADFDDMPRAVAKRGFANRDFSFATHGALVGEACVLRVRRPPFAARKARTGQYVRERGEIWSLTVDLEESEEN